MIESADCSIILCVIVKSHGILGSVEYPTSGVIAMHSIYKSSLHHLATLFTKFIGKSSIYNKGLIRIKSLGINGVFDHHHSLLLR